MPEKNRLSPLVWVGLGIAGTGLGTGKTGLIIVGGLLALAGYVGKERILQELPPGIQRQIAEAVQADVSVMPMAETEVGFEGALPGPRHFEAGAGAVEAEPFMFWG